MCLVDYRQLAKALGTPPMFVDVLPLIVKQDEVELLLRLSERERSIDELSRLMRLSHNTLEAKLHGLFVRGFLKKRTNGEAHYSIKSFERIVDRYISEGRGEILGKYVVALAEYHLVEHVKRGRIDPHPQGKVLPVPEAVLHLRTFHVLCVLGFRVKI